MNSNSPRLPAVLVLALVGLPVILACGSGGGGSTSPPLDDNARQISNEELSRMVLSIKQLPREYAAVLREVENGVLTLDKAVESAPDSELLRAQLLEYEWESGYQATYQAPDEDPAGPAFVLSTVNVYKTSGGAAAKLGAPSLDQSSSPSRTLSPSEAALIAARFHPFKVDLADEAGGFRDETRVDEERTLSSAFVTFRRGRIIGQAAVAGYNLSDNEAKELEDTARELASKMNDQMSGVLAPPR